MITKNLEYLKIEEDWQAPYLYRQVNEKYYEMFNRNGYYPNQAMGIVSDIVLNLKPEVNEDGIITDLYYYKIRDNSWGHGRPQTEDLKLNASDKKIFSRILDECTNNRAEGQLAKLIEKVSEKQLPDGWNVEKISKNSIDMSKGKNTISLPIKKLLNVIEISHAYYECIYSEDFYKANPKIIDEACIKPLLSLLSVLDTDDYYEADKRKEEASKRLYLVEKDVKVKELCDAVVVNDKKTIRNNSIFVKESPEPLIIAIQNNDVEMIKLLLKYGADVNAFDVLEKAIDGANDNIFYLLAKHIQDKPSSFVLAHAWNASKIDYLKVLLKKGGRLYISPKMKNSDINRIIELQSYKTIVWSIKQLDMIYQSNNFKVISSMLESIANTIEIRDEVPWEFWYYGNDVANWAVDQGDSRLIKLCLKYKFEITNKWMKKVEAYNEKSFEMVKQAYKNSELFELACDHALIRKLREVDFCSVKHMIHKLKIELTEEAIAALGSKEILGDFETGKSDEEKANILKLIECVLSVYDYYGENKNNRNYERKYEKHSGLKHILSGCFEENNRQVAELILKTYPQIVNNQVFVDTMAFYKCYENCSITDIIPESIFDFCYKQLKKKINKEYKGTGIKNIVTDLLRNNRYDNDLFAEYIKSLGPDDAYEEFVAELSINRDIDYPFNNGKCISEISELYNRCLNCSDEDSRFKAHCVIEELERRYAFL